jgi:carboxylesterase
VTTPANWPEDSAPFFLPGGRAGVLLLHGFTATPQEMRFLGERLHAGGYTVHAPLISGHRAQLADLARSTWRDWLASADRALDRLRSEVEEVLVAGLSMGSLLALKLAHDRANEVRGLALLGTALHLYERRLERYLPLLRLVSLILPAGRGNIRKGGRDIADPAARVASPSYDAMPVSSLVNLVQLQRQVRPLVAQTRQPVLIVHARQDHACPIANVDFLLQRLPSRPEVELLDRSFHVVTVDHEKEQVADRMKEFADKILTGGKRVAEAS